MNEDYGRNLDLNLLRVFLVVAEHGSVTAAAAALYLTQPAVSAALRRLTEAVGAPLFARQGRGLVLTGRGQQLMATVRPHLTALVEAALRPGAFMPATSERTLRIGLSDTAEVWLLPPLLRALERQAPRMRLIALPVQFRTVGDALLSRRIELAVAVADELPSIIRRRPLQRGGFVCLFDPRHARIKRSLSERAYFAHDHVIVSYNGDLRGVVEDVLGKTRRVRCSVASFHNLGAIVDGTALLATVPDQVAQDIVRVRPQLRTVALPFDVGGPEDGGIDLLWSAADDDDGGGKFVRDEIVRIAEASARAVKGAKRRGRRALLRSS